MTIEQARCFVAVARELHYGRAAERVGFTQPAVSRHVLALERSLGVVLLERTSREVSLTAAGIALLPQAEFALRSVQDAIDAARAAAEGRRGAVRIAFTVLTAVTVLGEWVHRIKDQVPDIELTLIEMVTDEQLTELEAGRLDLGVIRGQHLSSALMTSVIHREPLVAVLPKDHRLATQDDDPMLTELAELDIIQHAPAGRAALSAVGRLLDQRGIRQSVPITARQIHTAIALVDAGLGAAIVPASASRLALPNVVFRSIGDRDIAETELRLAWRGDNRNPAAAMCRGLLLDFVNPGHGD